MTRIEVVMCKFLGNNTFSPWTNRVPVRVNSTMDIPWLASCCSPPLEEFCGQTPWGWHIDLCLCLLMSALDSTQPWAKVKPWWILTASETWKIDEHRQIIANMGLVVRQTMICDFKFPTGHTHITPQSKVYHFFTKPHVGGFLVGINMVRLCKTVVVFFGQKGLSSRHIRRFQCWRIMRSWNQTLRTSTSFPPPCFVPRPGWLLDLLIFFVFCVSDLEIYGLNSSKHSRKCASVSLGPLRERQRHIYTYLLYRICSWRMLLWR